MKQETINIFMVGASVFVIACIMGVCMSNLHNNKEINNIKYSTIKDIVTIQETFSSNTTIFIMSNGDIVVYPLYDFNNEFIIGDGYVYSIEYIVGQTEGR